MFIVNLTENDARVDGYPIGRSPHPARCVATVVEAESVSLPDGYSAIRTVIVGRTEVRNLPPAAEGWVFIVSEDVAAVCPERSDLYFLHQPYRYGEGEGELTAKRLARFATSVDEG
jgi:hypothetical protein